MYWPTRKKSDRAAQAPKSKRRSLLRDRSGLSALEFAIVGPPMVLLMVFITEITYDYYTQAALNYAVQMAARNIQVGNAQGVTSASAFKTTYLCPAMTGLLSCNNVSVNVIEVASNYANIGAFTLPTNSKGQLSTSSYGFCPGSPNQLMLVEALYQGPSIVAGFVPGMAISNGTSMVHPTIATAAFVNENFPVTSPLPVGC